MDDIKRLESATAAVERRGVDVTDLYHDWLVCGFACASVGEAGRSFFHRLSRFSSKYNEKEANAQFDACLRGQRGRGGVAPLFTLLARFNVMVKRDTAGISPVCWTRNTPTPETEERPDRHPTAMPPSTPRAPDTVEQRRAEWNSKVADASTLCEMVNELAPPGLRAPMVSAFIVAASSVCDGLRLVYGGKREHVHLYQCVIGDAGGGKSHINKVRAVLKGVHQHKRDAYQAELASFKQRVAEAKKTDREGIERPPQKLHFVPADVSKAALIRLVKEIGGGGIIWETEIDTLTSATAGEFGHFGDFLRKNFHSEPVSSYRKMDDLLNEVDDPHLSILMTGTPDQMRKLFPSAENGLFSRFLFFNIAPNYDFSDPFTLHDQASDWSDLATYVAQLDAAYASTEVNALFSETLKQQHVKYWSTMAKEYATLIGSDSLALIRRLALIHARASAVITALKSIETGDPAHTTLDVTPEAWELARALCASGAQTAAQLLTTLPQQTTGGTKANLKREMLLRTLPPVFTPANFPPDVSRASAYRYLSLWKEQGLITQHGKGGKYVKVCDGAP